jgi:C-terminal processing protease CtpA/Prc
MNWTDGNDSAPNDYFHFQKPVMVLCNASSFSATDGFLSAFASLPQVTLLGQPSGGGSGTTRRFTLGKTGTEVALSSMASFRANGKTFDGNGVEVDVAMLPTLEDFISYKSDSVLQRAIELIKLKRSRFEESP